VNQELLLKNEYLVAENRILKAHIRGRLLLSDGEKATLAEIAKRVGRKALAEIARVAKPDTMLAWYRNLIAQEVRRGQAARRPRAATGWTGAGGFGGEVGSEQRRLGLRPHCGSTCQSGAFDLRSNGRKHPAAAWCSARIRTREEYDVEGFHR
jgi:hypothetical protein